MMRSIQSYLFLACFTVFFLTGCEKDDDFNEGPFLSKRTDILAFQFADLEVPVDGVIDEDAHTVTATVPFGTDRSALTPTITVSDKAIISPPSGVTNDFTAPVSYLVTAEDGTEQEWIITVNESDQGAVAKLVLSDPVWNFSPSGTGVPDYFTEDGERGLAYGNGHLYLTNNNDKILILNPADGAIIGELSMEGVDGGSPKISDVEVSEDGTILACNTVEWTSDEGGEPTTFKIYKWDEESSTPTVFLSYTNTEYRMGDSFSVIGDISDDAVIMTAFGRKFLNPATRGDIVFRWTVTDGVLDPDPELIQVQGVPTLAKLGSRPHAEQISVDSEEIYVNANDIDFTKIALDGTFLSRIPNTGRQLYDGFTSYFEIVEFAEKRVIVSVFPRSSVESRLLVIDITNGLENVTSENVLLSENLMTGEIANVNAGGSVTYHISEANRVEVYLLITNQALVKFNLSAEL